LAARAETEVLRVAEEVRAALADGRPVVALESSVITHGMPHPANLGTARDLMRRVRENGAVPAIIAVADGRLHVGLDAALLERLGTAAEAEKVSRRDLAGALANHAIGGTTVAATMLAAHWSGIAVFATGGIGGVHRGASETFDISADLSELARTPVAVVCAGAKSILDIAKTLEFLETRGVPVLGYRTDEFPAFFTRASGHPVDRSCASAEELAAIVDLHWRLGLGSGIVIANPIPPEDALAPAEVEAWIAAGLREADAAGIGGKALTPFLLDRVNALSQGRSLAANMALLGHNAAAAATLATALARLRRARARGAG
jgi:pseudouridine-5'-phosphate glycosidase